MNGADRSLRIVLLLAHEVAFYICYTLLAGIASFLVAAAVAGFYGNAIGRCFYPFLPPLVPLLAPLMVALVGVAQPSLAAASMFPMKKVAPTASSP
jgi:hypothetical protein